MIELDEPCPCTSGEGYKACCRRFHRGVPVDDALQLMRSRFSAYALGLSEYIIDTTHPANPEYSDNKFAWKRAISQFSQNTQFNKLDVYDFKEKRAMATVTFVAHITQGERDATFTEKSFFEKIKERWLYRGGQLSEGKAPNMVTVGQLRVLPLAYYGEPILRMKAEPVREITEDLKALADEMIETMDVSDGIGLAAPQIHHSIRMFVIRTPIETEDDKYETGDAEVFVNPEILSYSEATWKRAEGCLSIPGIRAEVERPREITVEYTNLAGEQQRKTYTGMAARVILHENDHINGVLFVDRLPKEERELVEPLLQNIRKRIHGDKPM